MKKKNAFFPYIKIYRKNNVPHEVSWHTDSYLRCLSSPRGAKICDIDVNLLSYIIVYNLPT